MYLKTLTLKGFKSFADKATLSLEPGITAIVGPNGSGKSNISDAVLWVLGERNAKHLRGQAMEDVIFAGSSARKATSVAEVELVLDNSDRTLPVDFSEVVIARRMYRTGESEYLINGTIARRLDVLDILHDTGLGVGTHSIISQGSIDSVLQSKPEDRRNLIEEAAGVLKHKQRLARSARKLERMSNHVERVTDVVNEVGRQLGPLERKAKRAKRYVELAGDLAQAKLLLAVDDLRKLKQESEQVVSLEKSLAEQLESKRAAISGIDSQIEELQNRIKHESEDAGVLSRQQRMASSASDRIDSAITVMRDRRRSALSRASEIELALEASKSESSRLDRELVEAKASYGEEKSKREAADARVNALKEHLDRIDREKSGLEANRKEIAGKIESAQSELTEIKAEQEQTQEALTNGLAHIKVLESHTAELELLVQRSTADAKSAEAEAQALEDALSVLEDQEKAARNLVGSCRQARETAKAVLDEAHANEQSLRAQISALDEIERKSASMQGDARAWVDANAQRLDVRTDPLSHIIRADGSYESIVELLLGSDMSSVVVSSEEEAARIAESVQEDGVKGELTLVAAEDPSRTGRGSAAIEGAKEASRSGRVRLLDHVQVPAGKEELAEALLGDVVVCETLEDAIGAHASDKVGLRFAVADGSMVWPSGKITLGMTVLDSEQGVLARVRHLEELRSQLEEAVEASHGAKEEAAKAEDALMSAQSESLKLSEKLAELRGNVHSARALAKKAADTLASNARELDDAAKKKADAQAVIADAKPDIERIQVRISELNGQIDKMKAQQASIEESLIPLQNESATASEELNESRLEAAKAAERAVYAELMVNRHADDLKKLRESAEESKALLHAKRVSAKRLEALMAAFDILSAAARRAVINLEERATEAESSTSGLHSQAEELRRQSHASHSEFDAVNEQLSNARVSKARIEMQVESAVHEIVEGCGTPLETALCLPPLENREEVQEEAFRLDKRIANLGTINPDAAEEYEELKSRYDYLSSQLADLTQASRTLSRINRMIEMRMKDDFVSTFAEINENFKDVFAMLFPGGQAHLSLEDPEDPENSGVEVNAQPAGKRISKMSLMSGGEKSLTALALLFALYRTRPTPFYILDEVEAALDDTNLRRLTGFIAAMRDNTQLIMITHQRRSMEMADVLFGVSMQADGVTKVVSQKLEHALRNAD